MDSVEAESAPCHAPIGIGRMGIALGLECAFAVWKHINSPYQSCQLRLTDLFWDGFLRPCGPAHAAIVLTSRCIVDSEHRGGEPHRTECLDLLS